MNIILISRWLPGRRKRARVVLILKIKIMETENDSSYGPICLLNTLGRLYEVPLRERLAKENSTMLNNQYIFRKGRSTIQAIQWVVEQVKASHKKWSALLHVDIKNAFNTVKGSAIPDKLSM
ncbi:hypothetical protein JTB14_010555 [Gonioctena quinquepunctata]|nr:hypothetical protein JTB14_010555 [Gonioctena quinquepunctata]